MKLEELKAGTSLVGLEPNVVETIAAVVSIGEGTIQVFYRMPDGVTKERLLGRADEEGLNRVNDQTKRAVSETREA